MKFLSFFVIFVSIIAELISARNLFMHGNNPGNEPHPSADLNSIYYDENLQRYLLNEPLMPQKINYENARNIGFDSQGQLGENLENFHRQPPKLMGENGVELDQKAKRTFSLWMPMKMNSREMRDGKSLHDIDPNSKGIMFQVRDGRHRPYGMPLRWGR